MEKNEIIHISVNDIDSMKLKKGDQVKCIRSTVEGREGTIFTVSGGQSISKKRLQKGDHTVPKWWLSHCSSYGDRFEKSIELNKTKLS
jgi:uncharacterized Zn ribbon protein